MGIGGIAPLVKWVVIIILATAVIPYKGKVGLEKAEEAKLERTDKETFDLGGYVIEVVDYTVDEEMFNTTLIRKYTFTITLTGNRVTVIHLQRHFRSEWESTGDATFEYTAWALEEEEDERLIFLKDYPEYNQFVLDFPAYDIALNDIKELVKDRYLRVVH